MKKTKTNLVEENKNSGSSFGKKVSTNKKANESEANKPGKELKKAPAKTKKDVVTEGTGKVSSQSKSKSSSKSKPGVKETKSEKQTDSDIVCVRVPKEKTKVPEAGSDKGKETKTKSSKKNKESFVPEVKEGLSGIIPNAYGIDKFKEWTEAMEEVTCKQVRVSVKSNAGKSLHPFQIKLYLRDLAEKNNLVMTNLQLFDDHFEFTLVQPADTPILEVK